MPVKSNSHLEAAWELKRYQRHLTFADRKLDAKERLERVAQHYFNRNVLFLTVVGLWSIATVIPNDLRMRLAGMVMALWVIYRLVKFVPTLNAMRVLVASGEGQRVIDELAIPAEQKSPLHEQAELDLEPYLGELNYAELQLMAEGSYQLLANSLHRRKVRSALLGVLATVLIGIFVSPGHGLLIGAFLISGFLRAGRAHAVVSGLVESESTQPC